MVAAVGEFQMPAGIRQTDHYPAESFMIGKAAKFLQPQPGAIHAGAGLQFADRSGDAHVAERHNDSHKA
jgi:hypothetical protein